MTPELKTGLLGATFFHFALFSGIPGNMPAQYEVTVSPSSLEVSLVASKPKVEEPAVKEQVVIEKPQVEAPQLEEKTQPVRKEEVKVEETSKAIPENPIRGAFTKANLLRSIDRYDL